MGRYIGPIVKIAKKFNDKVFSQKFDFKKKNIINKNSKKRNRQTEYGELLTSKEKFLYLYNIRDKQLSRYIDEATRKTGNSEDILIQLLETRLDNVVYRFGIGKTRKNCRQLVSHKHICVNGRVVNIASYNVKIGDIISFKNCNDSTKKTVGEDLYSWLTWENEKNVGKIIGLPTRKDVPEKIKIKDLIEIHAR